MGTILSDTAYRPLNRWNCDFISPGAVGTVGDALMSVQLQATFPGDFREEPWLKGNKECEYGSNVTDGYITSYTTGAGPPAVYDSVWDSGRAEKTSYGWKYEDLRATDRSETAILQATPQYSWRTQIATVNRSNKPNNLFLVPNSGLIEEPKGGYRGGLFPTVVAVEGGGDSSFEGNFRGGGGVKNETDLYRGGSFGRNP